MNQKEINYSDIKALGFTEEFAHDQVYFNQYGYEYAIIQKKLTKKIYLDWEKETRLCRMVRQDDECNILGTFKIEDLDQLKSIINFFIPSEQFFAMMA